MKFRMVAIPVKPEELNADHPFILKLVEKREVLLFSGRISKAQF